MRLVLAPVPYIRGAQYITVIGLVILLTQNRLIKRLVPLEARAWLCVGI